MLTRIAAAALSATAIASLTACGSDQEDVARELCHERVAANSVYPDGAEFVETEALDPVESTYFFHGMVEFPMLGEMVPHAYRCTVNPEIEGSIFNETVVERINS
ncbi:MULTISPECIES: hypothetical protein [unclassified Dietzia]|uniref:hypothetical protein n=1 Tax=unclassified Dietzia TaxID=2617939 RepID=UPI000D1FFE70|nr:MULTISPECIES: hypothetical protein [unclassified Dietzia]AVZ39074.1 hypothetical protein CT688_05915 [Dietzia sp. JS16-p6b]QGW24261.1 hypothetical protein GJR88_01889 [Dietzia sp. DQ12-45-1b]